MLIPVPISSPQSEGKRITVPLTFLQKAQPESSSKLPSIEFDVHWVTALANRPIEVDLIVDFGNTRTTCLLLEDTPEDGSTGEQALVRRVQSLRFNKRGTCFDKDSGETIINSWFLTHETGDFSNLNRRSYLNQNQWNSFIPDKPMKNQAPIL